MNVGVLFLAMPRVGMFYVIFLCSCDVISSQVACFILNMHGYTLITCLVHSAFYLFKHHNKLIFQAGQAASFDIKATEVFSNAVYQVRICYY